MIPIGEVPESTDTNIVPFITANIAQIAKIVQYPLDKFVFTQLLQPPSTYEKAFRRSDTEK